MSERKIENLDDLFACQLNPSPDYLSEHEFIKEDGTHREITVTISGVTREEIPIPGTSKTSKVPCLNFEGKAKRLPFGTKAKRLAVIAMHGKKIADWKGKSVTLYWDASVKYKGAKTGGIRIK